MPPSLSKPRFTRKEPYFPSVERVLEDIPTSVRLGEGYDLRPSHVFRHPYPRRLDDDDDDLEEVVYGIRSSYLIPTWMLEEDKEDFGLDEVHQTDSPAQRAGERRSIARAVSQIASSVASRFCNMFKKSN